MRKLIVAFGIILMCTFVGYSIFKIRNQEEMGQLALDERDFYFKDQGIDASLFNGPLITASQLQNYNALDYRWIYKLKNSDTISIVISIPYRSAGGEPRIHLTGSSNDWVKIIGRGSRK